VVEYYKMGVYEMEIQKYKARIKNNKFEIIGYIVEIRESIGKGCYSNGKAYMMYVSEISMPNSIFRGGFLVDKNSIEKV